MIALPLSYLQLEGLSVEDMLYRASAMRLTPGATVPMKQCELPGRASVSIRL